jgi:hypothetical protein
MQRAERLVLIFLACLLDRPLDAWRGWPQGTLVLWTMALIAAGTFLTSAHRTVWIARALKAKG